jgi:L-iditol 2-dehydrogenase
MKVAVYYSNNDVRLEERPVPTLSDGEILVRMMASGICGTDVMQWYRRKKSPRVLGHEMAGEIVKVGKGVTQFKAGDRVFVSHHVPCTTCHYCREGNYTACESLHTGNYDPGGFSEYIRIPRENVEQGTFLLPHEISYDAAAMIEPLACVICAQKRIGLKEKQGVLVIGSGVSGLLHIQMAKRKGATVFATDINEYRMRKAKDFGADHVFNAALYSPDELKRSHNNRGAERVIVCAGANQAIEHAVASVERRGVILFFAVPGEEIALPSMQLWRNEITLAFSYGAAPEDIREAIAFIKNGTIKVKEMITHRIPLSCAQEGFRLVSEAGDCLKVVIVPDESPVIP